MQVKLTYYHLRGGQFYATASYEVPDDTHNEAIVTEITQCANDRCGLPGLSLNHSSFIVDINVVHNPDFDTTKRTFYYERGNYHYLVIPESNES